MAEERKHKHLEFIQGILNRLSTNSFLIKKWSVVLASALFALSAADSHAAFVCLAYIPTSVFWGLDGFFLYQERLYRKLYDHVREQRNEAVDFSMDTTPFKTNWPCGDWVKATFSKTLIPFYVGLIFIITMVYFWD